MLTVALLVTMAIITVNSARAGDLIVINETAESQDASNWTGGSPSTSNTVAKTGTYSISTNTNQASPTNHTLNVNYTQFNITIKAALYSGTGKYTGIGFAKDTSNYYYFAMADGTTMQVRSKTTGSWVDLETNSTCTTWNINEWYDWEINISKTGAGADDIELIVTQAGVYRCTYATTFDEAWADSDNDKTVMIRHGLGAVSLHYWDDVVVYELGAGPDPPADANNSINYTLVTPANASIQNSTTVIANLTLSDIFGDPMNVTFYRAEGSNETANFTIIGMPDTQNYVKQNATMFENETQAIYNMLTTDNVQAVMHVGDMINDPETAQQWIDFNNSMAKVINSTAFMPLGGNHENIPDSDWTNYHLYYNYTTFDATNRGHFDEDNTHHYYIFNYSTNEMGIISTSYDPTLAEHQWVNETIGNHSHISWIFVTHDMLQACTGNPRLSNNPSVCTATGYGNTTWNRIVKHHDNIIFTYNGHWINQEDINVSLKNVNDTNIEIIKANYQQDAD